MLWLIGCQSFEVGRWARGRGALARLLSDAADGAPRYNGWWGVEMMTATPDGSAE
jgi:hypothetical protein